MGEWTRIFDALKVSAERPFLQADTNSQLRYFEYDGVIITISKSCHDVFSERLNAGFLLRKMPFTFKHLNPASYPLELFPCLSKHI
jgi:hypothetical protein